MQPKPANQIIDLVNIGPAGLEAYQYVNEVNAEADENGAANGIRTRDPKNHNLVL